VTFFFTFFRHTHPPVSEHVSQRSNINTSSISQNADVPCWVEGHRHRMHSAMSPTFIDVMASSFGFTYSQYWPSKQHHQHQQHQLKR